MVRLILAAIIFYLAISGIGPKYLNKTPELIMNFFEEHVDIEVEIK